MTEPERPDRRCTLVEQTDGYTCAYAYPDEESAESWYRECRNEWNAGRNLIFYFPGGSHEMRDGDTVAHIELTTRQSIRDRGVDDCWQAVTFG